MEIWIIYAIVSAITSWFYNFTFKVIAKYNYNTPLITYYSYISWALIAWLWLIYYLQNNTITINEFIFIWILALFNTLLFSLSIFSRVESMKNIDTVIFFPLYKTFWPIMVTMVSIFFFKETLDLKETLWIIIGIMVPLLLINNRENKVQKNLLYWVILVIITSILTVFSSIAVKQTIIMNFSIELFIFLTSLFGIFFNYIIYKLRFKKHNQKYESKWIIKFSIITWLLHFLSFVFFAEALVWNFAIAFTINSFSILIPIILSIIFYKEHFNLQKWIVIFLSIISIILFI